jgi:integrase
MNDKIGFEEYMMEHLMLKTQENYGRSLRYLEKEGVDLDNPETFREWVLAKRSKGTLDRTINIYIRAYNLYLKFLGRPMLKSMKENENPRRPRATQEDYDLLLKACSGYTFLRDRLMVELLFKSGVRYSELISLTTDDLDLEGQRIVVRAGKGQKYREIFMFPSVRDAVQKYLPQREIQIRQGNRNTKALFINQYGTQISKEGGRNVIYRIAKRAGISFSPHRARRFYARYLWDHGVKPEIIMKLMGHSDMGTTLIYMQVDQDDVFKEMRNQSKKLDFRAPEGDGVHNLHHIIRPGRGLLELFQIVFNPEVSIC